MIGVWDPTRSTLWKDREASVQISGAQGRLLDAFLKANGRTLTRDFLLGVLYDDKPDTAGPKILDVFIHRLRKRLAGSSYQIEAVWGIGYCGVGVLSSTRITTERCPCCGQAMPEENDDNLQ